MEAAVISAVVALLTALVQVAPEVAKVFTGGRTVEQIDGARPGDREGRDKEHHSTPPRRGFRVSLGG